MKTKLLLFAVLFCACQKQVPQPATPSPKPKTDTVYSYNWSWSADVGAYAYEANPQTYVGNDIVQSIIATWIRPAYSNGAWVKLPCKGFFTPTDSVVFDSFHGIRYKEGAVTTPQNIDVKAFANISN